MMRRLYMNSSVNNEKPREIQPSGSRRIYSSIENIRATAWLYGIDTVEMDHASILMLGCKDGTEMLPFSLNYPNARIVGIELESEQYESKQQDTISLAHSDLQLFSCSLAEFLESELGLFDYIVLHNSFALLSNELTDTLLLSCQQRLSSKGVMAVDWLCQPGAKLMESVRDAVQIHSGSAESLQQQVTQGRKMLSWLQDMTDKHNSGNKFYAGLNEQAEALSDTLFAHHYLSSHNESSYFIEFNGRVEQAGLMYVGDLRPATEHIDYYNKEAAELWLEMSQGNNKILAQQYLDIAINRSRRFSLLTTAGKTVFDNVDYERLAQMKWAGSFRRQSREIRHNPNHLAGHDGVPVGTDDITTLGILDVLGEAWPSSVSFEQLVFQTRLPDDDPELPGENLHEQKVLLALTALFKKGMSGLHFQREAMAKCQSHQLTTPVAIQKQLISATDNDTVINLWHERVNISAEERDFLLSEIPEITADNLDIADDLVFRGLLNASVLGWKRYYQQRARLASLTEVGRIACSLLLFSSDRSAGGFYSPEYEKIEREECVNSQSDTDDEVTADLIIPINKLIINGDNAKARELVVEKLPELLTSLTGNYYLVRFYKRVADYPAAILSLSRMLSFNSTSLFIYSELAMALYEYRMSWQAGRLARAILRCDKSSGPDWFLLGTLHKESKTYERAEYCARQGVKLVPNSKQMIGLLGSCLCEQAKTDEGIKFLKQSIKHPLVDFGNMGGLAFILTHSESATLAEIMEYHRGYATGAMHWASQQKYTGYQPENRDPHRKLRIGFVSGDFRAHHPVDFFFRPVWASLDRDKFEVFAYNSAPSYARNSGTDYYESTATGWRDIQHASTIEFAEMVKADEIDILIDLAGHTAHNRLLAFALKPAPVQISWVGYHATTGLPTVDYYATIFPVPKDPALEAQFTEKMIYLSLPRNFGNESGNVEINELPALKNGYFTFGSFNRPNKINDKVLDTWAEIILSVPDSRMIISNIAMVTWPELRGKLAARGIEDERIILRESTDMQSYLKAHNEVDLLLDTFPFTGGTVTNHAAWMGVPTISLSGETLVSRQGASIMYSLGLPGFVANNKEDYIAKAVSWAGRLEELNRIRLELRGSMEIKHNQKELIGEYVGEMLSRCWQTYCRGEKPESFSVGEIYDVK